MSEGEGKYWFWTAEISCHCLRNIYFVHVIGAQTKSSNILSIFGQCEDEIKCNARKKKRRKRKRKLISANLFGRSFVIGSSNSLLLVPTASAFFYFLSINFNALIFLPFLVCCLFVAINCGTEFKYKQNENSTRTYFVFLFPSVLSFTVFNLCLVVAVGSFISHTRDDKRLFFDKTEIIISFFSFNMSAKWESNKCSQHNTFEIVRVLYTPHHLNWITLQAN